MKTLALILTLSTLNVYASRYCAGPAKKAAVAVAKAATFENISDDEVEIRVMTSESKPTYMVQVKDLTYEVGINDMKPVEGQCTIEYMILN